MGVYPSEEDLMREAKAAGTVKPPKVAAVKRQNHCGICGGAGHTVRTCKSKKSGGGVVKSGKPSKSGSGITAAIAELDDQIKKLTTARDTLAAL